MFFGSLARNEIRIGTVIGLILVVFLLMLSGCSAVAPTSYADADRQTHAAIAAEYLAYVERDSALGAEEKQRRFDLVRTWEKRIESQGFRTPGRP